MCFTEGQWIQYDNKGSSENSTGGFIERNVNPTCYTKIIQFVYEDLILSICTSRELNLEDHPYFLFLRPKSQEKPLLATSTFFSTCFWDRSLLLKLVFSSRGFCTSVLLEGFFLFLIFARLTCWPRWITQLTRLERIKPHGYSAIIYYN